MSARPLLGSDCRPPRQASGGLGKPPQVSAVVAELRIPGLWGLLPSGCTSVGSFLRPAILVSPAGTKRVQCWGLEPGGLRSTSSSAEPLTDGHRVVSVAMASGNLPRLVPILTAWPRLPPTLAQPVCRSSSSLMGGRLREAAGPSLARGRGQHLSHSSVSLAGVLGGGCP